MVTANNVADYVLNVFHQHGDCVTNLKMQKLVYYIQAWHLALTKKRLFKDRIEAWVHGPVIPVLYNRFKKYGFNDITENPEAPKLSQKATSLIDEVLTVYSGYSAYQLEKMTHNEKPWINAREGFSDDANCTNEISIKDMIDFYSSLAKS